MALSYNMTFALSYASELSSWITERWEQPRNLTAQQRVAFACFSIVRAHHSGMLVLLKEDARTSASALLRPLYESGLRGQWFHHCATHQHLIEANIRKDLWPVETMVRDLAKLPGTAKLHEVKSKVWKLLCDFTHGGKGQLYHWLNRTSIRESHTDPRRPPKVLHLWPPKLLHPGRGDLTH